MPSFHCLRPEGAGRRAVTAPRRRHRPGIARASVDEHIHALIGEVDFGDDTGFGGTGEDRLYGEDGADLLRGAADDDSLWGDAGDDDLFGGKGDDVLAGGQGADAMRGGSGADTFRLRFGEIDGDRILGFRSADGDRLQLQSDHAVTVEDRGGGIFAVTDGTLTEVLAVRGAGVGDFLF